MDNTRYNNSGLTVICLDWTNGFGSVIHEAVHFSLKAWGLDNSTAGLLAYLFSHRQGFILHKAFDILMGVFQGSPPSPATFQLYQAVPPAASSVALKGGLSVLVMEDICIYFKDEMEQGA